MMSIVHYLIIENSSLQSVQVRVDEIYHHGSFSLL